MDRGERRYRTANYKAKRLRYYYEYGTERWLETPWKVKGSWFMHEAPAHWINTFMTRPARRLQRQSANRIERGMDPDIAAIEWPDYKRPYIYYW